MKTEYLLYGIRAGNTESWQEELLTCTTDKLRIAAVVKLAEAQGFHSFRFTTYGGEAPVFGKNLLAV